MLFEGKTCKRCNESKALKEFNNSKKEIDGKQSFCVKCQSEYAKQWYIKNKKPQKDQNKNYIHQEVDAKQEFETTDKAAGYLAGIIDGEGSVLFTWSKKRKLYSNRNIQISNTDKYIINACISACDKLGITCNVRKYEYLNRRKKNGDPFKPEYRILINGQINAQIVLDQVPLKCKDKKERLEQMVDSFKRVLPRRQRGVLSIDSVGTFQHTWSEGGVAHVLAS